MFKNKFVVLRKEPTFGVSFLQGECAGARKDLPLEVNVEVEVDMRGAHQLGPGVGARVPRAKPNLTLKKN